MRMTIRDNFPEIARRLTALGQQASTAAADALTRAMQDAQGAIKNEMQSVFDRPTKYAINGTFMKGAKPQRLEARVWVKDNVASRGTPADRFLLPQIYGGPRGQKGMERLLQRSGLMPAGWFAVPGAGAQLDGNGNVKRSQIVQILSQLRLQRGAGFESRATGSARSNRTIARQGGTYFALPAKRRGLQPGIYLKRKFAHGTAVKPVFLFVKSVNYRPRLHFHQVGEATVNAQFPRHFDAEWAKAVGAARLRR